MRRRVGTGIAAVAAAAIAAVGVSAGPVSAVSESVSGKFQTEFVHGDDCQKQAPICATGRATGKLHGAFTFGVSGFSTPEDESGPPVINFTGNATIETDKGTLQCSNSGVLHPQGESPLVSLCIVTGGTGQWTGATGYLQVNATFAGGGASGEYVGKVYRD